ncbi:hypothetical protein JZ751_024211 [Albula glossodonta]|uniref:Peroxisomal membrane protein 11B n=1 Tax=Albula glossodonta TaxID=121402 RepID=A0A8T2MSE1_9TELE|nr:hypothetical protein JZ751_024211 [Albula glossodonta]
MCLSEVFAEERFSEGGGCEKAAGAGIQHELGKETVFAPLFCLKVLHVHWGSLSGVKTPLFRLGNTVNSLDAAKRTLRLSDPVLRLCLTVSNLNRALYFICDNVLWARKVGLLQDLDKERWRLNASRYYYFALVMSLTRDAYVIAQIMVQRARHRQKAGQQMDGHAAGASHFLPKVDAFLSLLFESLRNHPPVVLDTVKNVCDLLIPLDRLGIYQTNAGVVGFCGLLSSLLGTTCLPLCLTLEAQGCSEIRAHTCTHLYTHLYTVSEPLAQL